MVFAPTFLRRSFSLGVLCFVGMAVLAAPVRAEAQPTDNVAEVPEAAPGRTWYGWQTLLADGATGTVLFTSVALDGGDAINAVGFFSYVFASPVVHWSHWNHGRGFASLGLRAALPLTGILVGFFVLDGCPRGEAEELEADEPCGRDGVAAGLALGMVATTALDATVLAWDDPPQPPDPFGVAISPSVALTSQGAALGVRGVF